MLEKDFQLVNQRIEKLRKEINYHRYLYHVLDKQEIEDSAIDSLKHELVQLEMEYPSLITPDSPTQRMGGRRLEKFVKVVHKASQWSFNDAFTKEEMHDFDERVRKHLGKNNETGGQNVEYVAELKIDGCHIVLTYEHGLLKLAATRGDGTVGEDVTQNIKTIESIPLRLNRDINIIVEGEVWMSKTILHNLNLERDVKGEPLLANIRNTVAGALRQLDPNVTKARRLQSFIYDVTQVGEGALLPKTQVEELEFLKELGFKVNNNYKKCRDINEVIGFWEKWQTKHEKEDYGMDGIAVKVNSVASQKQLGYTGKAPRFCIAFKFQGKQITTVVENIIMQIGRTGALTPVAVLRPVKLGGVTIRRATLHNQDIIKKLNIRIGDTVIIQRAGEVIPEVVEVLERLRPENAQLFVMPSHCQVCHSELRHKTIGSKKEISSAIYCANRNCFAQRKEQLIRFASKDGFDIVGLGKRIIERFIETGLLAKESDIFRLTYDDIVSLDRFGNQSANNILNSINKSKNIILDKFLLSLGMQHLGSENAKVLARYLQPFNISKPSNLITHIKASTLDNISGFGPKIVGSVSEYFADNDKIDLLKELDECGVEIRQLRPVLTARKLANKKFVLTGTLNKLTREEAKSKIEELGGSVSESVSQKTDFVVLGDIPGSKAKKAIKLGIKTINEEEFLNMIVYGKT